MSSSTRASLNHPSPLRFISSSCGLYSKISSSSGSSRSSSIQEGHWDAVESPELDPSPSPSPFPTPSTPFSPFSAPLKPPSPFSAPSKPL
ncbi:UNVERIFIED_CONTAM: hypothetical protein Sradi_1544900 [Sesamum radiatum]|uniref:Uncharacterized protein n=1 Tax=Sesamum radiatum TaxID=300843 RepID=A0AAW2UAJ9_SESRA